MTSEITTHPNTLKLYEKIRSRLLISGEEVAEWRRNRKAAWLTVKTRSLIKLKGYLSNRIRMHIWKAHGHICKHGIMEESIFTKMDRMCLSFGFHATPPLSAVIAYNSLFSHCNLHFQCPKHAAQKHLFNLFKQSLFPML